MRARRPDLLSNALHGNARHHVDDVTYAINGHGHPLVFAVLLPLELGLFELVIQRCSVSRKRAASS